MEVQLIIKAPNQNVEDHTVNCTLDWTVKALKDHLSTAYPNKPAPKEQKLIYSGRLLPDHLILKEFLRHDENLDNVHILHLVYNGGSPIEQNHVSPSANNSNATPNTIPPSGQSSESVLRHRNATSVPIPPQTSTFYQAPHPASAPFAPVFVSYPQTAAQIAAMQQMYAYYFTQFMQGTQPSAVAGSNPNSPAYEQNLVPNQAAQRPENVPMERVVAEENEEGMNRDWLDHLFMGLRLLLFLGLLHLYTTPERLMIVVVCVLVVFLYHEGWFARRRHPTVPVAVPPNQPENPNNPQQGEELLVNPDPSANDEMSGENEIQATMDGNNPPHAQQPEDANNQSGSPLTFVTSFFSSLIPEPPPPAVNIN